MPLGISKKRSSMVSRPVSEHGSKCKNSGATSGPILRSKPELIDNVINACAGGLVMPYGASAHIGAFQWL